MPIPKCLKFLPCLNKKKFKKDNENDDDDDDDDITCIGKSIFSQKQISKAVAIVLSGYDKEIAAISVGSTCTPEMVDMWVVKYRPPFFENGMRCPPALIDWWIQELIRKESIITSGFNSIKDDTVVISSLATCPNQYDC